MPPVRVKSRPLSGGAAEAGLRSPSLSLALRSEADGLPDIEHGDSFREVIKKLSIFITDAVVLPCTFEQLRTTSAGDRLRALVTHLSLTCDNPCIVNALLALKWHYGAISSERSLSESRANACEIVAWRFLTHLSEREAVDFCLYEIPGTRRAPGGVAAAAAASVVAASNGWHATTATTAATTTAVAATNSAGDGAGVDEENNGDPSAGSGAGEADESAPLLARMWTSATTAPDNNGTSSRRTGAGSRRYQLLQSISRLTMSMHRRGSDDDDEDGDLSGDDADVDADSSADSDDEEDDPTAPFVHLNALEIAAVADAKRFLGQNVVQKIITGIWNGDIVFWDRLAVDAVKKPRFYNPHTADPFSRLRVPKYLKIFEALYFLAFLAVFYLTLLARDPAHVSAFEVLFYLFLAAFAYDELSEWIDAGSLFYVYDFWNLFDLIMICIGFTFVFLRILGLCLDDTYWIDLSFDILSLEALFMVPRISSILSLSPYWGTLIPCFKEMTKDFVKFMVLVVIIYVGFLTTFSLLGRTVFTLPHMTMVLTKIFFGSSYVGFDIMDEIDPVFGPPLMLVFVTLSSILLMGSLTGMLSNSFSRVMGHAREEYLYVYSIYVLEASTSNRLTHFYPPLNLLALVIFRPLRLFLPSDHKFRAARIALLKVTHLPIVGAIQLYELVRGNFQDGSDGYSARHGRRVQTPAAVAAGASTVTPRKTILRPSLGSSRPSSSSHLRHGRPLSTSEFGPARLVQTHDGQAATALSPSPAPRMLVTAHTLPIAMDMSSPAALEDTEMDTPSDVEVRITELAAKIDRLTELVLQMQTQSTTAPQY